MQMEEALTASAAPPSAAAASRAIPPTFHSIVSADDVYKSSDLQSQGLDMPEEKRHDHHQSLADIRKMRSELSRLFQDQNVAKDPDQIPGDAWNGRGDVIECSYGKRSLNLDTYRLYFRGLVCEEMIGNSKSMLAGIGAAICDSRDNPVFELQKPLTGSGSNRCVVDLKALIEGLDSVLTLGLKQVVLHCQYFPVFQFVRGQWSPKQQKVQMLVDEVHLLSRKFTYCGVTFAAGNDVKLAFKLAREAIVSQMNNSAESSNRCNLIEACVICLEDITSPQMFDVAGCRHRFCNSCMKQHVEVKLLHGMVPTCPHDGCNSELDLKSCKKFLTPKLIKTMKERIKEAGIPVTERVYCPYPRCSMLMTRSEVTEYAKNALGEANRSGTRKCTSCHGLFCINCSVPWHSNMTCYDYKRLNPFSCQEIAKLKSLATKNQWRQCVKCNRIIELAEGCFHMTCRCGYEFCYTCGAEWKNKRATCTCPLWDEDNIIHDDGDEGDNDSLDDGPFWDEDNIIHDYEDEDYIINEEEDNIFHDDEDEDKDIHDAEDIHDDEDDDNIIHDDDDDDIIHDYEDEDEDNNIHDDEDVDEDNIIHDDEDDIIHDDEYDDNDDIIHDKDDIIHNDEDDDEDNIIHDDEDGIIHNDEDNDMIHNDEDNDEDNIIHDDEDGIIHNDEDDDEDNIIHDDEDGGHIIHDDVDEHDLGDYLDDDPLWDEDNIFYDGETDEWAW